MINYQESAMSMKPTLATHTSPISLLWKAFDAGINRNKNIGCCFRFSNNLTGIMDRNIPINQTTNSPSAAVLSLSPLLLSFSDKSWNTTNTEDHIGALCLFHCPSAACSTSYLACLICSALSFSLFSLSFICFSSNSLLSCSSFRRSCSTCLACSHLRASSSLWGTISHVCALYQKKLHKTLSK